MVADDGDVTDNSDDICSDLSKNPCDLGVGIDVVLQNRTTELTSRYFIVIQLY